MLDVGRWLFVFVFLSFIVSAHAHDVGLSSAAVQLHTNKLEALLTFNARESEEIIFLDVNQDGIITTDEFVLKRDKLANAIATNCLVQFDETVAKLGGIRCQLDTSNNVDLYFTCELQDFKQLKMDFRVIRLLTPGHRMFFTLLGPSGDTIADRLLSQNSTTISIQMDASASETASAPDSETNAAPTTPKPVVAEAPPTFLGFIIMGVEHIAIGYDHLLFLFGLLIVARNFKSALLIITCFTIAHSITLGVATFDLVSIPPKFTESVIALSIVYVGVENLIRHSEPKGRWLLTFVFGLIHGFGFASVLRELGVGSHGSVVMPLFSFNLGVELGQIAIAAVALPIMWQLRKREKFLKYGIPACSVIIAIAGAFWFVQRVWF